MTISLIAMTLLAFAVAAGAAPPPPKRFPGMLPNGKPFVATMYYERYYEFPKEYDLMDRDLEDIAARGWTVAFTDYTHLSLGPIWDHYYEKAKQLGIYVLPDQWNACFHAGGPFFSRITLPTTETGGPPTGFAIGAAVRFTDESFVSAMVEYQSQVLSRYIAHPAYPRIMGRDGKSHPLMVVIYETGMADYDGHWIEYSTDTKEKWIAFQKERIGKVIADDIPKPTERDKREALVLFGDFRAKYLSDGWCAVARGLKTKFPGLYAMVVFRQHGLLEGSKSGVDEGGIGRRAIRPELWGDFDIVASEHDGDDGIEYLLAESDLIKSAASGRLGSLEYYLDCGYKAWTARPVEFHRPWGQSEMLGSLTIRGLLPMHYGYNERDDRAGIASTGRREKDAPLWQRAACEEAAEANKVFLQVAAYLSAAKPKSAKAAIVMPYEAYALEKWALTDSSYLDELAMDKGLVRIWKAFADRDVPVDWVFSSSSKIAPYKLLVVPDAPYSKAFEAAITAAEKKGMKIVRMGKWGQTPPATSFPNGSPVGVSPHFPIPKGLRESPYPAKPGVETGQLIGKGYAVDIFVNHSSEPVRYAAKGGKSYPASAVSGGKLTVPGHRTVWVVR